MSEDKLRWWSVHVQSFLAAVRQAQEQAPLLVLVERYLQDQMHTIPPLPDWRLGQMRHALEVFARAVDHWHIEREESERFRLSFRSKTTPEASSAAPPEQSPAAEASSGSRPWRDRMIAAQRLGNYSLRTEQAYLSWVTQFLRYHHGDDPMKLDEKAIRQFLEHLALTRNVSASTQNQAFSALLFLYQTALERPVGNLRYVLRARRPARLPVVLSREEVKRLLAAMEGTPQLIARLLYGTGMRITEGIRLRVKDVDFDRGQIIVREGKGDMDRTGMLPQQLEVPLRHQLERVRVLWQADRDQDMHVVVLPGALERKYPEAGKE